MWYDFIRCAISEGQKHLSIDLWMVFSCGKWSLQKRASERRKSATNIHFLIWTLDGASTMASPRKDPTTPSRVRIKKKGQESYCFVIYIEKDQNFEEQKFKNTFECPIKLAKRILKWTGFVLDSEKKRVFSPTSLKKAFPSWHIIGVGREFCLHSFLMLIYTESNTDTDLKDCQY